MRRPRSPWAKRLGWVLVAVGGILFLMGQIGARTSIVFLRFDQHHIFEQFGGALIAIYGLIRGTS